MHAEAVTAYMQIDIPMGAWMGSELSHTFFFSFWSSFPTFPLLFAFCYFIIYYLLMRVVAVRT